MGRRSTHSNIRLRTWASVFCLAYGLGGCAQTQTIERAGPIEERYLDLQSKISSSEPNALIAGLWKIASELHDARPWISLGYLYYQKGDIESSLACYGFALHYDPENRSVHRWFLQNRRELYTGQSILRWKAMRNADGYNVSMRVFENSPWVRINEAPLSKPEYRVFGLRPEETYQFRISALQIWSENDVREGPPTPAFRKRAFHGTLGRSKRVTADTLSGGRIRVVWQKSQEPWANSYHIYILMPGSAKPSLVTKTGPTKKTKWIFAGLPRGLRYKIIVVLVGKGGREEVYSEVEVELPLK